MQANFACRARTHGIVYALSSLLDTVLARAKRQPHLKQLLELAQLVGLRPQLRHRLHRVADDGDLVRAARLLAVQQLRQLVEAAGGCMRSFKTEPQSV